MQVITFDKRNAKQLQESVQAWLIEHPGVTIYSTAQSHDAHNEIVLTVFYTE